MTAILTSVIRTAINFNIPLIFYGEDGEVEYGGSTETRDRALFDIEYMKTIYLEGGYEKVLSLLDDVDQQKLYFWQFPEAQQVRDLDLFFTHWSYFEPWDSYRNYIWLQKRCGLQNKMKAILELLPISLRMIRPYIHSMRILCI